MNSDIGSKPHEAGSSEEVETNIRVLESRPDDTEVSTSTTGKTSRLKTFFLTQTSNFRK